MVRTQKVIGFGAIAIDDILYVDRPFSAGKGKVVSRTSDHGGNVATALVAVAKLGGQAGFVGWLGEEPYADTSVEELMRHGVDVSRAPRRADARAIRSVITVGPDGDRFIAYDDEVPHGTADSLDDAVLAEAAVLMIDGYATVSEPVVARARSLDLAVVADIEWTVGAATDRLIALANHLVLPMAFAVAHAGSQKPEEILKRLWSADRDALVLTDGDRGAYVRQKGDPVLWLVPALPVKAVDTTGAGDCFHGAYAYGLAEGRSPLEAVCFANRAAAISVTGCGGRKALPDQSALAGLSIAGGVATAVGRCD